VPLPRLATLDYLPAKATRQVELKRPMGENEAPRTIPGRDNGLVVSASSRSSLTVTNQSGEGVRFVLVVAPQWMFHGIGALELLGAGVWSLAKWARRKRHHGPHHHL